MREPSFENNQRKSEGAGLRTGETLDRIAAANSARFLSNATSTRAQGIAGSFDFLIGTPQTIYYTLTASNGAPNWGINAERYDI
ncbi:hypothetical protein BLA14095_03709 [Burkholderia lata]|uniref:hypothetical protein n=1 Tax=Burkholderia lata (strain ATCC 17760 / DSM 23089 / LMG 22485 / NCIMB 9086 / R18194 / 383) TaxID=482957 RepID=UPI0014544A8D|nr:hypothetical protein [Burkholderia lata]VWB80351.1 hypothetical protein BLA14095_03709 [Burkholderia lata]